MGHKECPAVFACGTSVQALIIMETLGWVNWVDQDNRFDNSRFGTLGNSGGGTLSMFLFALADKIQAASPSGYPSSFEVIARKEKVHCHCNVLPGLLGRVEMWQLLACSAPKPLQIFQGAGDPLFPKDVFWATADRIKRVYQIYDKEILFHAELLPGEHSWTEFSRKTNSDFFAEIFDLDRPIILKNEKLLARDSKTLKSWPDTALTTEGLACQLTGKIVEADLKLADVFLPKKLIDDLSGELFHRGDAVEIFAQLECWLSDT